MRGQSAWRMTATELRKGLNSESCLVKHGEKGRQVRVLGAKNPLNHIHSFSGDVLFGCFWQWIYILADNCRIAHA